MPRVYLAGPWLARPLMPAASALFEAAGYQIVTRWWEHADAAGSGEELVRQAAADLSGVWNTDAFVLLHYVLSEGKACELGYAIALDKPIIVVTFNYEGVPNLFHFHPSVRRVSTITDAITQLNQWQNEGEI